MHSAHYCQQQITEFHRLHRDRILFHFLYMASKADVDYSANVQSEFTLGGEQVRIILLTMDRETIPVDPNKIQDLFNCKHGNIKMLRLKTSQLHKLQQLSSSQKGLDDDFFMLSPISLVRQNEKGR